MSTASLFKPQNKRISGTIKMPGDKSISQRAIFLASMASGTSHIYGAAGSSDVMAAVNVMRSLGAKIKIEKSKHSNPINIDLTVTGWGDNGPSDPTNVIDCGNSATCARLLMGLLTSYDIQATIDGDESLRKRPFKRVIDPLSKMGARFKYVGSAADGTESMNGVGTEGMHGVGIEGMNGVGTEGISSGGFDGGDVAPQKYNLPCNVIGTSSPTSISYNMPVASAQVKSAVLFAGLNANCTTKVVDHYVSRNHTELMLKKFGANICVDEVHHAVLIDGPCKLHACDIHIPGDISSAAYFATGASITPGSNIKIENVGLNPTRMGFVNVLKKMGANITTEELENRKSEKLENRKSEDPEGLRSEELENRNTHTNSIDYGDEPVGNIYVSYNGRLKAIQIEDSEIPGLIDEVPILSIAAASAQGETIFHGVSELKQKESDRIDGIVSGLENVGCKAVYENDNLHIFGNLDIENGVLECCPENTSQKNTVSENEYPTNTIPADSSQKNTIKIMQNNGDHRLAITWSMLGLCGFVPIRMSDVDVMDVSYPSFLKDLESVLV